MKRIHFSMIIMILALVLAACGTANNGNNNDTGNNDATGGNQLGQDNVNNNTDLDYFNNDNENNNQNANNQQDDGDMRQRMEELGYKEFDLKVEYGDEQEYEAELTLRNDRVEAELEDDLNGIHVKGKEAFEKIFPLVEKLTIDQDTDKADAIAQALEVFDLKDDYTEFELEIELDDGTKVEFDDRK